MPTPRRLRIVVLACLALLGAGVLVSARLRPSADDEDVQEASPSVARLAVDRVRGVPRFRSEAPPNEGPPEADGSIAIATSGIGTSAGDAGAPAGDGGGEVLSPDAARSRKVGGWYVAHQSVPTGNPSRAIRDFDIDVWHALHGRHRRLSCLSHIEPVRGCATALRLRRGYASWNMRGIIDVRAMIADEELRLLSADIIDFLPFEDDPWPPDKEFFDCYREVIPRIRIACPNCRDGALAFRWNLEIWIYPDNDEGKGKSVSHPVDPMASDPGFRGVHP